MQINFLLKTFSLRKFENSSCEGPWNIQKCYENIFLGTPLTPPQKFLQFQNDHSDILFRVLAQGKSSAYSQNFLVEDENSVWKKIRDNNMNEESFLSTRKSLPILLNSNSSQKFTVFSGTSNVKFYSPEPCLTKVAWKAPSPFYESYGFPRNSPLFPFFNHAYKKIRESGAYHNKKNKWAISEPGNCKSVKTSSIPIKKVISLFALLLCGVVFSGLILVFECFIEGKKQLGSQA